MATRIILPDAGQTTDELLLVEWRVSVGDTVALGDVLADIETDKAVSELESHAAGSVLALLAEEGDTVRTGQTLVWIGKPGEEIPEETVEQHDVEAPPTEAAPAPVAEAHVVQGTLASPAARELARARGLDVARVSGSGPDGCVVRRDIRERIGGLLEARLQPGTEGPDIRGTSVPISPMRRAIAERLQQSVREAPHFCVVMDVDMSRALELRDTSPVKLTINGIIVKACADALVAVPRVNCRIEGDAIHYLRDINIGIAVGVEDGLVVPVLEHVDRLTLAEVAERSRRLVENARAGRLPAGPRSTFTVSNLGMYDVKWFTAIINPPESAILAVGAIEDRLVLTSAGIVARPTLTLTLSSDHRVIDGVLAAQFLAAVKQRLEAPDALVSPRPHSP